MIRNPKTFFRRLVHKVNNRWLFEAESWLGFVESGPMCVAKMVFEGVLGNWSCLIECVRGSRRQFWRFWERGTESGPVFGVLCNGDLWDRNRGRGETQSLRHRFSAFWLRSKCSICSYQLNIWYVDHVSTSILIWFFQGEWLSEACFGSFTSWPGIAVPPGSAHFPIINPNNKSNWHMKYKERAAQCGSLSSITQILCEINFGDSRSAKTAVVWHIRAGKFMKIKIKSL